MSKATVQGERVVNVFLFILIANLDIVLISLHLIFFVCFVSAYFTVHFCIVQLGLK